MPNFLPMALRKIYINNKQLYRLRNSKEVELEKLFPISINLSYQGSAINADVMRNLWGEV